MLVFGRIEASEQGPELHDNPCDHWILVLWGRLDEYSFPFLPVEGEPLPALTFKRRRFLSFKYHKAEAGLRYMVGKPCWVLAWQGKPRREWGFWHERRGYIGKSDFKHGEKVIELQHFGLVGQWVHNATFCTWVKRWKRKT